LPGVGVTHHRNDLKDHLRDHYASFIAPTGSCVRPNPSQRLGLPRTLGLCRLSPVPAGRRPVPTLSLQSLHRCLDPYPAVFPRSIRPFLPREHRPYATGNAFGTRNYPCNATATGSVISGLQSFVHLQAPMLARPPGRTHRSTLLGGQAVYTTHRSDGCPFRDVASLHVRHGQLTWLDFHQLDCSLVGRSFPHSAFLATSPQGLCDLSGWLSFRVAQVADLVVIIQSKPPIKPRPTPPVPTEAQQTSCAHQVPPNLLLDPVLDVGKTPARVADPEVVYPAPKLDFRQKLESRIPSWVN